MEPEILVGAPQRLAAAFVDRLERQAAEAIAARGTFSIALPGGSVAVRFFPHLAGAAVDWNRADIFWSDERAVASTDPESNFALAERLLLRPAGVPRANVHRLAADLPDLPLATGRCTPVASPGTPASNAFWRRPSRRSSRPVAPGT